MGKRITKWVADDGEEFVDERSMRIHELRAKTAEAVAIFVEGHLDGTESNRYVRFSKIVTDAIMAWEELQLESDLAAAVLTAADSAESSPYPSEPPFPPAKFELPNFTEFDVPAEDLRAAGVPPASAFE
jgi:hypothetical protein